MKDIRAEGNVYIVGHEQNWAKGPQISIENLIYVPEYIDLAFIGHIISSQSVLLTDHPIRLNKFSDSLGYKTFNFFYSTESGLYEGFILNYAKLKEGLRGKIIFPNEIVKIVTHIIDRDQAKESINSLARKLELPLIE